MAEAVRKKVELEFTFTDAGASAALSKIDAGLQKTATNAKAIGTSGEASMQRLRDAQGRFVSSSAQMAQQLGAAAAEQTRAQQAVGDAADQAVRKNDDNERAQRRGERATRDHGQALGFLRGQLLGAVAATGLTTVSLGALVLKMREAITETGRLQQDLLRLEFAEHGARAEYEAFLDTIESASLTAKIFDDDDVARAASFSTTLELSRQRFEQLLPAMRGHAAVMGGDLTASYEKVATFIETGNARMLKSIHILVQQQEIDAKAIAMFGRKAAALSKVQAEEVRYQIVLERTAQFQEAEARVAGETLPGAYQALSTAIVNMLQYGGDPSIQYLLDFAKHSTGAANAIGLLIKRAHEWKETQASAFDTARMEQFAAAIQHAAPGAAGLDQMEMMADVLTAIAKAAGSSDVDLIASIANAAKDGRVDLEEFRGEIEKVRDELVKLRTGTPPTPEGSPAEDVRARGLAEQTRTREIEEAAVDAARSLGIERAELERLVATGDTTGQAMQALADRMGRPVEEIQRYVEQIKKQRQEFERFRDESRALLTPDLILPRRVNRQKGIGEEEIAGLGLRIDEGTVYGPSLPDAIANTRAVSGVADAERRGLMDESQLIAPQSGASSEIDFIRDQWSQMWAGATSDAEKSLLAQRALVGEFGSEVQASARIMEAAMGGFYEGFEQLGAAAFNAERRRMVTLGRASEALGKTMLANTLDMIKNEAAAKAKLAAAESIWPPNPLGLAKAAALASIAGFVGGLASSARSSAQRAFESPDEQRAARTRDVEGNNPRDTLNFTARRVAETVNVYVSTTVQAGVMVQGLDSAAALRNFLNEHVKPWIQAGMRSGEFEQ